MSPAPSDVGEYLDGLADDARPIVLAVLDAACAGLPGAEERIRYGMPAVMLDGRYALHVGGWKKHVGLYPVGPLPPELEREVAPYRAAKDTVKFDYAAPVPYDLVTRIATELRARRVAAEAAA